jgi:hypothetical protein
MSKFDSMNDDLVKHIIYRVPKNNHDNYIVYSITIYKNEIERTKL